MPSRCPSNSASLSSGTASMMQPPVSPNKDTSSRSPGRSCASAPMPPAIAISTSATASPPPERSRATSHVLEYPDHPDRRRRVDGSPLGLVVQAHVPANDRSSQSLARLGHALDAGEELVVGVGLLRAAEVQAVRYGYRLR